MRSYVSVPQATSSIRKHGFFALLVACCFATAAMRPASSFGQIYVVQAPERLHTNQLAKIFLGFEGEEKFDGAYMALPITWSLVDVVLVSENGSPAQLTVKQSDQYDNRYYLFADQGFSQGDQFVLESDTGYLPSTAMIRLVPFQMDRRRFEPVPDLKQEYALQEGFAVETETFLTQNWVLALTQEERGVVLPTNNLAPMNSGASFTAEMWLKTADANAILMSTWDGNETSPYPLEISIDEASHVVFLRGVEGEHQALRSSGPVADGSWHHIAVTQDAGTGWMRLFVDGLPSDSLHNASQLTIPEPGFISISGRPIRETTDRELAMRLDGFVDEVRIWPEARDASLILSTMRESLPTRMDGMLALSFEEDDSDTQLGRRLQHLERVRSDLSFYAEVEDFALQVDAGTVLLTWKSFDSEALGFTVERSVDGSDFDDLSVVLAGVDVGTEPGSYWYRDIDAPDSVAFYRIKQRFSDGAERTTQAVQAEMGSNDESLPASLTGNSPNPFNAVTSVTYQVRERGQVHVSVWDISGQMVVELYDGIREVGSYDAQFDGEDQVSGMYFVRLETSGGVSSHQMVLAK